MEMDTMPDSIDPSKFEIISLETIIKQVDNNAPSELNYGSITEFPSSSKRNEEMQKCEVCPSCGKYFNSKLEYLKHKVVHKIPKKSKQSNPLIVKLPSPKRTLKINDLNCEYCSECFSDKSEYDTHLNECQYKCKVCLVKFKNSDIYDRHISVNSLENPFYCEKCSKWCNLKCHQFTKCLFDNVKSHFNTSSEFTTKGTLIVRETIYEKYPKPDNNNPLICDICQEQFKYKLDLRNHQRCHFTQDKPYSCNICLKKFKEQFSLTYHLNNLARTCLIKCDRCSKEFINRHYLNLHICYQDRTCKICSKVFPSKHQLMLHMNMHTREKPHVCNICSQRFSNKQNLKQHVGTHFLKWKIVKLSTT